MFRRYRESFLGFIELEPTGGVREATSLAAEWMVAGGSCAVGTVGGVGGFADVCELTVFLQTARRRRVFVTPEQIECLYRALAVLTEQAPAAPVSSVSVDSFASCQTVKYVYDRIGSPIPSEKLKTLTVRLRAEVARRGRLLKDQELVSVRRDFMKNR